MNLSGTEKKCQFCQSAIEPKATVCPTCQKKQKKPFYKKWWVWAIVVVVVIGAFGANGGDTAEAPKEPAQEASAPAQPEPTTEEAKAKAKELDAKVYDIILRSEKITGLLQQGMTLVSSGQASLLDLYDLAKQSEESQQSLFGALMDTKDDGSRKYIDAAQYYVSNAKSVATDVKKYIDKNEMKYLSSAKESLGQTERYTYGVLAERMSYLSNQGFTDIEVSDILAAEAPAS